MNLKRIVITGGPSTGKTSVIKNLENKGYFCVHELIRSMTAAEKNKEGPNAIVTNPIISVKDPKKFNQQLLEGRVKQFNTMPPSETNTIFFDRGIPDVYAYMRCFGQTYEKDFAEPGYTYRYDTIFLMPPWEEIYQMDNERFETFEESIRIFKCLENAYVALGYKVLQVPKGTIEQRTHYILNSLKEH